MNLEAIEPLATLNITPIKIDQQMAQFALPLAGNRNDKGTLFAGSQYSALVIAGWSLATSWAKSQGLGEKVAIKECSVKYPKAAVSDLVAKATFDKEPDQRLSGHWRCQITVVALDEAGDVCGKLQGDYRILHS